MGCRNRRYAFRGVAFSVVFGGAAVSIPHEARASCDGTYSTRLLIWCAIETSNHSVIDSKYRQKFVLALANEGYMAYKAQPQKWSMYAAPVLAYSNNVNGGSPDGVLEIGGLQFRTDEQNVRRDGFLIGGTLGLEVRQFLAPGRYVDLHSNGSISYSQRDDSWVKSATVRLCSKNHLMDWWYLDACLNASETKKRLSDQSELTKSIAVSKAFTLSTISHHLGSIEIAEKTYDKYDQLQSTARLETAHRNGISSNISMSFGKVSNDGFLKMEYGYSAGVRGTFQKRDFHVFSSFEHWSGGKVLGYEYDENRISLGIAVSVSDFLSATLGYQWIDSTIDHYDSKSPIISANLPIYRF